MFKVPNIHGKEIWQAETFKEAVDIGMLFNEDFMVKEGTRKADIIDQSMRDWHRGWNNPELKSVLFKCKKDARHDFFRLHIGLPKEMELDCCEKCIPLSKDFSKGQIKPETRRYAAGRNN